MKVRGNIDVKGGSNTRLAIFRDEKSSTQNGGTLTAAAWNTRTLNTTIFNNITGCSLGSNQVTLPAGSYSIEGSTPAYRVGDHKCRLFNITTNTILIIGTCAHADTTDTAQTLSTVRGVVNGPVVLELQHYIETSSTVADGGNATGVVSINEVYSELIIRKL